MQDTQKNLSTFNYEKLAIHFLSEIFTTPSGGENKIGLLKRCLNEQFICCGFPEFNPQNITEFSGFINYLWDVFRQPKVRLHTVAVMDNQVLINLQLQGEHCEEFLGLTASPGRLQLNAHLQLKFIKNKICEIQMHNKKVTLTTIKGEVYQLVHQGEQDQNSLYQRDYNRYQKSCS